MTPYERLLAEELPTGTFGGGKTEPSVIPPDRLAAIHRAQLEAALNEKPLRVGRRAKPIRHLHAVPEAQPATARPAATPPAA